MSKRAFLYLAVLIVLTPIFSENCLSQEIGWYHCSVEAAGNGYVKLTDLSPAPAFRGKWFRFPASHAISMQNIALRAFHRRLNVNVRVYEYSFYSMIYSIYITQTP